MSSFEAFKQNFSAVLLPRRDKVTVLRDEESDSGCTLLVNKPRYPVLVVDCEADAKLRNTSGARCDFLLCVRKSPEIVLAVEMKGESWKAKEVCDQLQGGAQLAESALPETAAPRFFPVLLARGTRSPIEYRQLSNCKITFKGRGFPIILEKCGVSLERILDQYAAPHNRK